MIDNIVKYSNDKIERTIQKITPEVIAQKGNGSVVKLCTQTEIHAFIGLLTLQGTLETKHTKHNKAFFTKVWASHLCSNYVNAKIQIPVIALIFRRR